jgi:KDO2-lipid IV(A) lauroyltransferase
VFAVIIARIYYLFARQDKINLTKNLKIALGENVDKKAINKIIRRIFINFAKYLADFFKFSKLTEEDLREKIEIVGAENIDKCMAEGKGAIALSPHIGNWELGAAIVAALGYKTHAIVLEHKDKRINNFFTRQRTINNIEIVPLGFQVKKCFAALKDKGVLAIAGDKNYTPHGDYVEFFGKKAFMPKGPAVFSLKTGSPIIPCSCIRKKDNTFKIQFEKPIELEPTGDFKEDVRALMAKYMPLFEKHIRKYPGQWYAFQEIWNHEPITQS